MRPVLTAGLAVLGFIISPRAAAAQAAVAGLIAPGSEELRTAADLRLPPAQPEARMSLRGGLTTSSSRGDRREGEILMIVGAAGIVTGLLVDEDLITIAGAGVGGFGLYLYLKAGG
jgi:hypothetical protein